MQDGAFRFFCRLANDRKLSLEQLFETYDEQELAIWKAYDEVIGLDDLHLDLSYICTILANANAGQGKKYKLSDFLHRSTTETYTAENFDLDSYLASQRAMMQKVGHTTK